MMTSTYPVSLLLDGRACLVVGAGRVAERKIAALLNAGAVVRVVALEACAAVQELADRGDIELSLRQFRDADLDGVFIVIVATDDTELNQRVSAECDRRGLLVNVVDQPALCNFYVPAVIERGPITLAVSTGGASPALAKHLRVLLEDTVGEEYGRLAELMAELRAEVIAAHDQQSDRAAAWERVLASEVLDLLRRDETDQARRRARELLGLPV
jgi:siroheme synthase-like protein